jgi:hypothetical protein
MIVEFTIGTLPGQNPIADYLQDSRFGDYRMIYWLINGQPNIDFTQDRQTRRATWNQTFNNGDKIICHFASY